MPIILVVIPSISFISNILWYFNRYFDGGIWRSHQRTGHRHRRGPQPPQRQPPALRRRPGRHEAIKTSWGIAGHQAARSPHLQRGGVPLYVGGRGVLVKQRVFFSIENGRDPERQENPSPKKRFCNGRKGLSPLLSLLG